MEGFKQQLADQPALEPVDDLVELEEIVEGAEGDEEAETPIGDCKERQLSDANSVRTQKKQTKRRKQKK